MTVNMDPVIGRLGWLELRWYGLIMAVALIIGLWIVSLQLKRRNIAPQHAWQLAIIAVPCGIIGARLFHVVENMGYYWNNPGEIFGGRLAGLAIYGVVTGGLLGLLIYCRWKKLPMLRVLDSTALAFPVAQIIGKSANIINGDTWGDPTSLPWGITYLHPDSFIPDSLLGIPTHPTPVYEQLWLLVVVGVLWFARKRIKTDGMAILLYLGLYSFGRFFISFFRVNKILFLGLKEAQVIAIVVILLAIPAAIYLHRRAKRQPPPAPQRQTRKSKT